MGWWMRLWGIAFVAWRPSNLGGVSSARALTSRMKCRLCTGRSAGRVSVGRSRSSPPTRTGTTRPTFSNLRLTVRSMTLPPTVNDVANVSTVPSAKVGPHILLETLFLRNSFPERPFRAVSVFRFPTPLGRQSQRALPFRGSRTPGARDNGVCANESPAHYPQPQLGQSGLAHVFASRH